MAGRRERSRDRGGRGPEQAPAGPAKEPVLHRLFAIDVRSLAAFRIAVGLVLLVDLGIRVVDLQAMYCDGGMFPRALICRYFHVWNWSFHFGGGGPAYQATLFGLQGALAVALVVGFGTRLAAVASWLMLVSLHNRAPPILSGTDNLLRMLLFWGMFLPLGDAWSADAWLARRRGVRRPGTNPVRSVASAAILLQMAFLYLFSAAFKSNADWFHGGALQSILSDFFYSRPIGIGLLDFPVVLKIVTVGILALEWLAPFLLFCPIATGRLRLWVIGLLGSMHVGVAILLNVGLFSLVALAGLILFLPPELWDRMSRRFHGTPDSGTPRTAAALPPVRAPQAPAVRRYFAQGSCSLALAYVLFLNINGLPGRFLPWTPQPESKLLTVAIGLGQKWNMFAEAPSGTGWCVARAILADASEIDLLRDGAPVDWRRPDDPPAIYPNHRWLKCFREMSNADSKWHHLFRRPVAEYLYREWNRGRPPERRAVDLSLILCLDEENEFALGLTPPPVRQTLARVRTPVATR